MDKETTMPTSAAPRKPRAHPFPPIQENAIFQAVPPAAPVQNGVLHLRIVYTLGPGNTVPPDGNIPYDYDAQLSGVYNLPSGDIADFTDKVRTGALLGLPAITFQNTSEAGQPGEPRVPWLSMARYVVYSIVKDGAVEFRTSMDAAATDDTTPGEYYHLTHVLKLGGTIPGNDLSTVPRTASDKCYVIYFRTACPSAKGSLSPPVPDRFNLHVVVHQNNGVDVDAVIDPDIKNTGHPPPQLTSGG